MTPLQPAAQSAATPFLSAARAAALLLAATPITGCCNLALLWCGPDESRWISIDYRTPAAALATFTEAARRDRADVVYETLSQNFKESTGIPGGLEAALFWERLKDQVSGLHVLWRAEVSEATRPTPNRASYLLELEGYRFRVGLIRQPFAGFRYEIEGDVYPAEEFVDWQQLVSVTEDEDLATRVTLRTPPTSTAPPGLRARDVVGIEAGHRWKIDSIEQVVDA